MICVSIVDRPWQRPYQRVIDGISQKNGGKSNGTPP